MTELPPGPWTWQHVIPQGPVEWGFEPATEPGDGVALVAADGQWLVSSETGYGTPEVHPAAKELLAQAWRLAEDVPTAPKPPLRSFRGKLAHLAETLDVDPNREEAITDLRFIHHYEQRGTRTYLVLVVDGKASVARVGIILDRGQSIEAMERLLEERETEWRARIDGLTAEQQRQFAARVEETVDPFVLLEQVVGGEDPRPTGIGWNCVYNGPDSPQEPTS